MRQPTKTYTRLRRKDSGGQDGRACSLKPPEFGLANEGVWGSAPFPPCRPPKERMENTPFSTKGGKMGSRADGTNPRALGTNPRALGTNPRAAASLEKFPVTPIKPKLREKWYAGKRYADDHVEIVWGRWEECKHLFQNENHSRCRGFWRKQDAEAWIESLPAFSNHGRVEAPEAVF